MFYIHIVLCLVAQYTFSRKLVACSHTIAKFPLIWGVGNRYVKYLEQNTVNHIVFKLPRQSPMNEASYTGKKSKHFMWEVCQKNNFVILLCYGK
jgi:hypothetical protein